MGDLSASQSSGVAILKYLFGSQFFVSSFWPWNGMETLQKDFFLLAIRTNYIQYIYNYQFYEPMGCHMLWRDGYNYPAMLSRTEVFIVLVDHMARYAWAFLGFLQLLSCWLIGWRGTVIFGSVCRFCWSFLLLPLVRGDPYGVIGSRRTRVHLLSSLEFWIEIFVWCLRLIC